MTFQQLFARVRARLRKRQMPCALAFYNLAMPRILAAIRRVNSPRWQELPVDAAYVAERFYPFLVSELALSALQVAGTADDAVYQHASAVALTIRLLLIAEFGVPIPSYTIQSPLDATAAAGFVRAKRGRGGQLIVWPTKRMVALVRRAGRSSGNPDADAAIRN
ncbi:MAG: hypothetical protein PHI63_05615 [Patescibacteria group bacterium]|nr:hypothetical protein [Patescibacteria group bacterium]